MLAYCTIKYKITESPSARKVWIEILFVPVLFDVSVGHLPRGRCGLKCLVYSHTWQHLRVTFREEGVDWNKNADEYVRKSYKSPSARKVWIEIKTENYLNEKGRMSPSARKVWIEIKNWKLFERKGPKSPSARKVWIEICFLQKSRNQILQSPSARKVWIEICMPTLIAYTVLVTFREEGVDWNQHKKFLSSTLIRHLPRGRCGLK